MRLLFLCLFVVFVSCVDENKELPSKIDYGKTVGGVEVKTVEYDGCEYIVLYHGVSHKGNCKNKIHCYNEID